MNVIKTFSLYALMICLISAPASANIIKVGMTQNFKPYNFIENSIAQGVDVDIATAILEKLGYRPVFIELPAAEEYASAAAGKVDMLLSVYCDSLYPAGLIATEESLYTIDISVFESAAMPGKVTTLDDLATVKLGGVRGDINILELQKQISPTIHLAARTELLIGLLVANRIDAALGEDIAVQYHARLHNQAIRRALAYKQRAVCMAVSATAMAEQTADLLKALNQQIKLMKQQGQITRIVNRYISPSL